MLNTKGSIGNKQMEVLVEKIYDEFEAWRKQEEAHLADEQDIEELKEFLF